jgi:hypothetical protein
MSIGPPWDFNYALGNCVHKDAHVPRGWRFYYEAVAQGAGSLHWYSRLMQVRSRMSENEREALGWETENEGEAPRVAGAPTTRR